MKKYYFFVSFALLSPILYSQTVTGRLIDDSGAGMSDVRLTMYVVGTSYVVDTGYDGYFTFENITGIYDHELPLGYEVSNNYPNPFNPKTRILFSVPQTSRIKIGIYNSIGQIIKKDIIKVIKAGTDYIDIELDGMPNGVYIAHIALDDRYYFSRKMILLYGSQHLIEKNFDFRITSKYENRFSSLLETNIDSIVASSIYNGTKTFTGLVPIIGNTTDVGELVFERHCPGIPSVLYEGKSYSTVQIGNQCWLSENLNVGIMINGDVLSGNNSIIEKYCYKNDLTKCEQQGAYYVWDEAMQYSIKSTRGICPEGWHVPDLGEFELLTDKVDYNGNALKAEFQGSYWTSPSGFDALIAGYYYHDGTIGHFADNQMGQFWSATPASDTKAKGMSVFYNQSGINLSDYNKSHGYNVRCLKD